MHALDNPYTPNAGAQPQAMVGRHDQLTSFELLLHRLQRGRTEQSMLITGLRGVGKTVLLGQFRSKALAQDWVVVELEVSKHDEFAFRRAMTTRLRTALLELSPMARWTDHFRRAAAVLRSFNLSIDPSGALTASLGAEAAQGYADHHDLDLDLTDLLLAIGEAAAGVKRGVVLLLDEVQFLDKTQLSALIQALHKVVQRNLPITLVGAGLPQLAELAGDAKSYSERLFTFPRIGHLTPSQAREALQRPAQDEGAHFTDEALDEAVSVTDGYPYFIQELGYAVWLSAFGPTFTRQDVLDALPAYQAKLDESFFRVRLDRATELQRSYLRAMAELGPDPQRAQDVAAVLNRTSSQVGPTRAELINMGLLYTPEHGYAAFTVPHFDKFLVRAMPQLSIPTLKRRNRGTGPNH